MDQRPSVTHIRFLNYVLLIEQGYYPHEFNAFIKVGPCESEKKNPQIMKCVLGSNALNKSRCFGYVLRSKNHILLHT